MMKFLFDISRSLVLIGLISFSGHAFAGGSPFTVFKGTISPVKGSIILLPAANGQQAKPMVSIQQTIAFFSRAGFDVVVFNQQNNNNNQVLQPPLTALLSNYRTYITGQGKTQFSTGKLAVVGFQSGANLLAKLLERLETKEQPAAVLLVAPTGMDQRMPGTVLPQVMPPLFPQASLFSLCAADGHPANEKALIDYVKTYIGFGGTAQVKQLKTAGPQFKLSQLPLLFPAFFKYPASPLAQNGYPIAEDKNPAAIPVEGYSKARHQEKLALIGKEKFNLLLIGNSITNNFEKEDYQPIWNQFFAPRKAVNLGFSGYRTENLLWNIDHGELQGQSPKVIILEIGTNNVDEKNYPTRHTAQQLAGGITAIVKRFRSKLPDARIILLRCFPGSYDGPNPTSHRAILERASDLVSKLDDGKNIFYCDVSHVFLNLDGSINPKLMADYLHPTPAGAKAWAQAMEPLLAQLMGDKSRDHEIPTNTAIVPVSRLEMDSYNWFDRHTTVLALKDSINPEIVQIGNSITHFWGGLPLLRYPDGKLRTPNGPKSYATLFSQYRVLNMGFGWDRTQNVLWRLDHGELDGLHPRVVIVNIGTNNTSETENARMNTPAEIVSGISAICSRIRSKVPGTRIIVMAVFPREEDPQSSRRILIQQINQALNDFARNNQLTFLDIGPKMLQPDGHFLPGMMLDFTHPSEKGYEIWADALRPVLKAELLR